MFAVVVTVLALAVFPVAAQVKPVDCGELGLGIDCAEGDDEGTVKEFIINIVNIFLTLIGVIAAIYLIIGGVRYIMSQGNQEDTKKAKNTILYALIGLLVIGLSAVLVNFVIGGVGGGQGNNNPPPPPPPEEEEAAGGGLPDGAAR